MKIKRMIMIFCVVVFIIGNIFSNDFDDYQKLDKKTQGNISLLNYLVEQLYKLESFKSKIVVNDISDEIKSIIPASIDKATQDYCSEVLGELTIFKITEIDRDRADWEYQAATSAAIYEAMPSPYVIIGTVSLSNSPIKAIANIVGVAGNSYLNYKKALSVASFERQKTEFELQKSDLRTIEAISREAFNYRHTFSRNNGIDGKIVISNNQIQELYKIAYVDLDNNEAKIRRLENLSKESGVTSYSSYWKIVGDLYFETQRYQKAQTAYENYLALFIQLFKKNSEKVSVEKNLVGILLDDIEKNRYQIESLLTDMEQNIYENEWQVKYFMANCWIVLDYSKKANNLINQNLDYLHADYLTQYQDYCNVEQISKLNIIQELAQKKKYKNAPESLKILEEEKKKINDKYLANTGTFLRPSENALRQNLDLLYYIYSQLGYSDQKYEEKVEEFFEINPVYRNWEAANNDSTLMNIKITKNEKERGDDSTSVIERSYSLIKATADNWWNGKDDVLVIKLPDIYLTEEFNSNWVLEFSSNGHEDLYINKFNLSASRDQFKKDFKENLKGSSWRTYYFYPAEEYLWILDETIVFNLTFYLDSDNYTLYRTSDFKYLGGEWVPVRWEQGAVSNEDN